MRPRCPLRRDLEGAGQGTHLSDLRTTDGPRSGGHTNHFLAPGGGGSELGVGWIPPGLILGTALTLLLAQLFHWVRHDGRSKYLAVLLLTAAGMAIGQGWEALGLPGLRLGQVNLLPAVLFAGALQTLSVRLTLRFLRS